jgi:succinate dehydrogenase/fumarate reductase iron-sulfur protein
MESIALSIRRGTSEEGSSPFWQQFDVPMIEDTMSVLDALIWVQRNVDPSLAFRRACRVGMCGTCGVVINGSEGLACRTFLGSLVGNKGGTVRVQPLRHLPVIRDLVVDPAQFFERLRGVDPNFTPEAGLQEPVVLSPDSKERRTINPHRECIYCGLCYSACSVVGLDSGFLGPAALNRAFTLVSDSRDGAGKSRLQAVASEQGLWRCHTIFECTAVCPKEIPITRAIQGLKRKVVVDKLKGLFRLGR